LEILEPWIDPSKTVSLHSKCKAQLEKFISQHKIILYSPSDQLLHAIKAPLLHYVNHYLKVSTKLSRSFQMKAIAGNNLSALVCPELIIVNLDCFYEGCTLEELLGRSRTSADFVVPWCVSRLGLHASVEDGGRPLQLCKSFGEFRTLKSVQLWKTLNSTLLSLFDFDAASLSGFTSMPALSFKCIWLRCAEKSGLYHQSIEKMKPFNEKMIRDQCRGGFSFSCGKKLNAGDPLWPSEADAGGPFGHLRASGLLELDIVSSYGYAASKMITPKGFCKGFSVAAPTASKDRLMCVDLKKRHKSWEFMCVYFTLFLSQKKRKRHFSSVYSNFHALGIYFVGPYPVDLAMTEAGGRLLLVNFDGQFCHGCLSGCPPLERYASGKTRERVEEETRRRDSFIRNWVRSVCDKAGWEIARYSTFSDCHSPAYSKKNLQLHFSSIKPLKKMMQPYLDIEAFAKLLTSAQLGPKDILNRCPDSVAFIAAVRCSTPSVTRRLPADAPSGPFFVCGSGGKLYRRQTGTPRPGESVILTKDYFDYLAMSRGNHFSVEKILDCLLYPRWNEFNKVFEELIERRNSEGQGAAEKRVLKNVVNYACGYFGLNSAKDKMRHPRMRLGTKLRSSIDLNKTRVFSVDFFGSSSENYMVFHSVAGDGARRQSGKKSSGVPVSLYLGVVEMGKLRLLQILDWLESASAPGSVRHLYTNVDNLILAIAEPDLDRLALLSSPRLKHTFTFLKNYFFKSSLDVASKPDPGGLKLEWQLGPETGWKFASCALQNWAVVTEETVDDDKSDSIGGNRTKTNLFAGVGARRSYDYACKMIDRETVTLEMPRRVNKMAGTEERVVQFKFVPK
jgi:hypothetical protein